MQVNTKEKHHVVKRKEKKNTAEEKLVYLLTRQPKKSHCQQEKNLHQCPFLSPLVKPNPIYISNKNQYNPLDPVFYLDLHQIILTHRHQQHKYTICLHQDSYIIPRELNVA